MKEMGLDLPEKAFTSVFTFSLQSLSFGSSVAKNGIVGRLVVEYLVVGPGRLESGLVG